MSGLFSLSQFCFLLARFWVITVRMSECWPLDAEAHCILYTEARGGRPFKLNKLTLEAKKKIKAYRSESAMLAMFLVWFMRWQLLYSLLSRLTGEEWSLLLMTPSATKQSLIIAASASVDIFSEIGFSKPWLTDCLSRGRSVFWHEPGIVRWLTGNNTTGMIYKPPLTRHGKRTIQVTNAPVSTSECI